MMDLIAMWMTLEITVLNNFVLQALSQILEFYC